MKKLLYQFDTDALPAVFDNVVGYDGGADHITAYGGVSAANVGGLVEGAIFTRGPKDKKNTAIFIGGGNMAAGQALLEAVQAKFFAKFRVSVMFDCNGSNTTAAAAVAWLAHGRSLAGKRAVVLAGTGPSASGPRRCSRAKVRRSPSRPQARRRAGRRAGDQIPLRSRGPADRGRDPAERGQAIEGAHIVLATGAAGITLLEAAQWQESPTLELVADANASPPAGIEGVAHGRSRHRGATARSCSDRLGFGALKLALHRACIGRLFEQNDLLARRRANLCAAPRPWWKRRHRRPMITRDRSTNSWIDLASGDPTPGGGSAAAIMGAMGAALVSMVCNVSFGKKGCEAAEPELRNMLARSEELRRHLTAMVGRGYCGFRQPDGRVQAGQILGRGEGAARRAIQACLERATEVPLDCARACAEVVAMSRRAGDSATST